MAEPSSPPPPPVQEEEPYHCANCLFIKDPSEPKGGFWACQNLCIRE